MHQDKYQDTKMEKVQVKLGNISLNEKKTSPKFRRKKRYTQGSQKMHNPIKRPLKGYTTHSVPPYHHTAPSLAKFPPHPTIHTQTPNTQSSAPIQRKASAATQKPRKPHHKATTPNTTHPSLPHPTRPPHTLPMPRSTTSSATPQPSAAVGRDRPPDNDPPSYFTPSYNITHPHSSPCQPQRS